MHLLKRGLQCPKVLVATHFHEVFTPELLNVKNLPITLSHMQVMFTVENPEAGSHTHQSEASSILQARPSDKITYLYR